MGGNLPKRIRRIGSIKAELITKSREAALSAIRVFNERRKLCLKWEDMFYDADGRYRIGLMAVFNPPPNAPGPTEWEKGEGFLSGGLPSLGKGDSSVLEESF